MVRGCIGCHHPSTDGAKKQLLGQHGVAADIGMNEMPVGIDQENSRRQAVERVCECRSFHFIEVDHLSDEQGAAYMRHEQPHAAAHFIVDHAVPFMPEYAESGITRRRLFQQSGRQSAQPCGWTHSL